MKKIIFSFAMMVMALCAFAQNQSNYAGSSKFSDNWSINLQGGVVTPFNYFFSNGSTTPTIVVGIDKYFTPWLGVGVEGRTSIGVGSRFNPCTAFDAVNVSGLVKFNLVNLFDFDGTRKTFEPVIYTGLGWGHRTKYDVAIDETTEYFKGQDLRNFMTYRAGLELNFNLGKKKAWGLIVNPSVVWGNINNGKLHKGYGNFEVTVGAVYRFKTSNGTRSFTKAKLYDQNEVDNLNARISKLKVANDSLVNAMNSNTVSPVTPQVVEVVKEKKYSVNFERNSSILTDEAKAVLDKIPSGAVVNVTGSTSPEGTVKRNTALALERAHAVKEYLTNRNVIVRNVNGSEASRAAIITVE